MAIRGDSFGTVREVAVYCRYLLDDGIFSEQSTPTEDDVEDMIDRVSARVNTALKGCGLTPSAVYANSTAKLMVDDFVVKYVAGNVELTQPGTGFNDNEQTRLGMFLKQTPSAFVEENCKDLRDIIGSAARPTSAGLVFTGLDKHSERADPDNTTREQPLFRRRQWDNPGTTGAGDESEDD